MKDIDPYTQIIYNSKSAAEFAEKSNQIIDKLQEAGMLCPDVEINSEGISEETFSLTEEGIRAATFLFAVVGGTELVNQFLPLFARQAFIAGESQKTKLRIRDILVELEKNKTSTVDNLYGILKKEFGKEYADTYKFLFLTGE